jgi:hypothetical protein
VQAATNKQINNIIPVRLNPHPILQSALFAPLALGCVTALSDNIAFMFAFMMTPATSAGVVERFFLFYGR